MTGKRWPPRDERGRFSRPAEPEVELPEGVPAALELPSALPERVADGVHTVWVRTLHELAARELLDVSRPPWACAAPSGLVRRQEAVTGPLLIAYVEPAFSYVA